MSHTKKFKELNKNDVEIAGGKGASLGEMTQAGIPVPPGYVVLSGAFEQFLEETDLNVEIDSILDSVDHAVMHTVESASEQIQGLILQADMPEDIAQEIQQGFVDLNAEFVAVRSSATSEDGAEAAWAGQLDTYLNTTQETLLKNVQRCWASLFTPRAIFYRFEKGLHGTDISVAVVVQKMIQSEVSGIAFSVHPVTEDYDQLIIEAGFGLGEAIVSGSITPDSFVVEKSTWNILDTNISIQDRGLFKKSDGGNEWKDISNEKGEQPTLSSEEVLELSHLIVRIEEHYGFPVDIEWAREGEQFYIVQSRPITTLTKKDKLGTKSKIVLSKIFSRERPFFYFSMWNDSDRMGFKRFVGHEVQHSLFLREENNNKGSVWYDLTELQSLNEQTAEKVNGNPNLFPEMIGTLDEEWKHIGPLLNQERTLGTIEEFEQYYLHLTKWWSAMTLVFNIPGIESVKEDIKKRALERRALMEKYSDAMHRTYLEFFKKTYPDYWDIAYVILPQEVVQLGKGELSDIEIQKIRGRLLGFARFNNQSYSLAELRNILAQENIVLEQEKVDSDTQEIKGTTAYPGIVQGKVRLIRLREQITNLQEGEVLVTEMTDPEFVPAMKKAAAIVTDEGGVMCHAAIVARELKKPCIIGTKIATQVLKDGDMVEVDADKGIVRILETDIPTLSKYQRLFQFDSLVPFIFSYGFVEAYAELDGLTFSNEKIWLSYMSLLAVEKTLQEGLELYKDSLKYDSYKKELYQTYQEIQQMSVNLQEGNAIDQEQLTDFFSLLSEYRILYQKTEFFYTDLAFEKKEEFTVIKDNFKSFEQFKLDGREYLNKIFLVPDSLFNNLLRKLSDQFNLSYEDLLNYSMEEILYLFDGEKVSPDTLVERQKGYVMYVQSGRIKNITGSKALDFIDRSVSQKTFSSELKGKIANKGKVTAKAKVFKISLSDYNKLSAVIDAMEQGQVLVAETTEPSIIAACKKAAAIVTNQGGMMSHAAIVAREMNIPCVIGVTDATEIIKDGDLIEVDADNGVIRILDTEN